MNSRNSIEQTLAIHRELMLATDKLLKRDAARSTIAEKMLALSDEAFAEFAAGELEDYRDSILDDEREGR